MKALKRLAECASSLQPSLLAPVISAKISYACLYRFVHDFVLKFMGQTPMFQNVSVYIESVQFGRPRKQLIIM